MTDTQATRTQNLGWYFRYMRKRDEELIASNEFLQDAVARHKYEGLAIAIKARWVALAVIGLFLPFLNLNFGYDLLYYEAILILFGLIGWAQLKAGEVGLSRRELLLIWADILLMTLVFTVPNPFMGDDWPTAMQYHISDFSFFFILLIPATMAYSWRTLISYGTWVPLLWLSAATLIYFFGNTIPEYTTGISAAFDNNPQLVTLLDPNRIDFGDRFQEVIVFMIAAFTLAINGWRTNQLLVGQAEVAQERSNLARYFPPRMVDKLASQDRTLGEERSQEVGLLFADIVGFTRIAEQKTPVETMSLLRDFHRLMEQAVFKHEGTLNKFLGDGLMATFGTPDPGPEDAANALAAAHDMIRLIDEWNETRAASGEPLIQISVGLHFGEVTLGNIGSERILEFAVIGDTVNVASRLEALTRELGTKLIVSEALYDRIKTNDGEGEVLRGLSERQSQTLRGRVDPVAFHTFDG